MKIKQKRKTKMKRKFLLTLGLIIFTNIATSCSKEEVKEPMAIVTELEETELLDLENNTDTINEMIENIESSNDSNNEEIMVETQNKEKNSYTDEIFVISDEEIQEIFDTFDMKEIKRLINKINEIEDLQIQNDLKEKVLDYLDNEKIIQLIDATNLDSELKNIVKSIMNDSPNIYREQEILNIAVADNEEEKTEHFIQLLSSAYYDSYSTKGYYRHLFSDLSTHEEEIIPLSSIHVFDNRIGLNNISYPLYFFLGDPTTYGNYQIYVSGIYKTVNSQKIGQVGTNYIVTDNNDKVCAYFSEYSYDCQYTILENNTLISLKSWLYENNLEEEIKESYTIKELKELTFNISRKLSGNFEEKDIIDASELCILEIPWYYNSEADNEENYYIMTKVGPYLFGKFTNTYMDLIHKDALITFNLSRGECFLYEDYENEVFLNLHCNNYSMIHLQSLNDFLIENGLELYKKDKYTKEEIYEIYNILNKEISRTRTK